MRQYNNRSISSGELDRSQKQVVIGQVLGSGLPDKDFSDLVAVRSGSRQMRREAIERAASIS